MPVGLHFSSALPRDKSFVKGKNNHRAQSLAWQQFYTHTHTHNNKNTHTHTLFFYLTCRRSGIHECQTRHGISLRANISSANALLQEELIRALLIFVIHHVDLSAKSGSREAATPNGIHESSACQFRGIGRSVRNITAALSSPRFNNASSMKWLACTLVLLHGHVRGILHKTASTHCRAALRPIRIQCRHVCRLALKPSLER